MTKSPDAPNTAENFKKSFSVLLKARYPYLYISTWEEERVLALIQEVVRTAALIRTPRKLFTWSVTEGIVENGQRNNQKTDPFKILDFIDAHQEASVFVLKDFHIYLGTRQVAVRESLTEPSLIIRKLRDLVPNLTKSNKPKNVVFVSPSLVLPADLEKDITIVDFDLPSFPEIQQKLQEIIDTNRQGGRIVIKLNPEEEERLAKAATGLTLQEAENAFARAMAEDGRLDNQSVGRILQEKRQIIKKMEILEFIPPELTMQDVGGLENLKNWFRKRERVWLGAAQRYGLSAPKGVLITGVPGCGKSLIAKAISTMWQLPLLRLDVGRIFGGLVGSSEENMRRAIKTAEATAPSILWIDEIEKGFSGDGRGDSGTSMRVFGTFLTWMQEKTKPVFVVATANKIHALPPEFLRKGRFDEIFFVDLPTRKERIEILRLHITKRVDPTMMEGFQLTQQVLEYLAKSTEGFIGAELEQVVVAGLFEAFSEGRGLRIEDFVKAVKNMVPLSVTQVEAIRHIREWANERAVAATPKEDRIEYAQSTESKADVKATRGGRAVDF
ncbi:MAG: AAA family ATPase [Xenococcaceae cyanobacterium]